MSSLWLTRPPASADEHPADLVSEHRASLLVEFIARTEGLRDG
jgi:hypothetical protein